VLRLTGSKEKGRQISGSPVSSRKGLLLNGEASSTTSEGETLPSKEGLVLEQQLSSAQNVSVVERPSSRKSSVLEGGSTAESLTLEEASSKKRSTLEDGSFTNKSLDLGERVGDTVSAARAEDPAAIQSSLTVVLSSQGHSQEEGETKSEKKQEMQGGTMKTRKPRNSLESDQASSTVDEALADFFSSPQTSARQRRRPPRRKSDVFSASELALCEQDFISKTEKDVTENCSDGSALSSKVVTNTNSNSAASAAAFDGSVDEKAVTDQLVCSAENTVEVRSERVQKHAQAEAHHRDAEKSSRVADEMSSNSECKEEESKNDEETHSKPRELIVENLTESQCGLVAENWNSESQYGLVQDTASCPPPSILRSTKKQECSTPTPSKKVRFAPDSSPKSGGGWRLRKRKKAIAELNTEYVKDSSPQNVPAENVSVVSEQGENLSVVAVETVQHIEKVRKLTSYTPRGQEEDISNSSTSAALTPSAVKNSTLSAESLPPTLARTNSSLLSDLTLTVGNSSSSISITSGVQSQLQQSTVQGYRQQGPTPIQSDVSQRSNANPVVAKR
jgi:hypothetical protein